MAVGDSYISMYTENHGGDCCGRKHIFELGRYGPTLARVAKLQDLLNDDDSYREEDDEDYSEYYNNAHHCVEVTLTSTQATQKASDTGKIWDDVLTKEFGFKRVFAFKNPNTDNIVYVYLFSLNERENVVSE